MIINVNNTIKWMNICFEKKIPVIPKIIYFFNRIIYCCDIRPNINIDKSVQFPHNALGVVVHHHSTIGSNTKVLHNTTIGGNMDKRRIFNGREIDSPIIGKNVIIGVGTIIIGPVIIGDNVIIGAGSIVTKDVTENAIVYGQSAEVKKLRRIIDEK